MATIALFGATGREGRRVLDRLLASDADVRVLVRNPDKLTAPPSDRLTVIAGDALDADAVDRTIAGSQAVISVLGHVKGSPKNLLTEATTHMVQAMQRQGITRIVTLTGGGVRQPQDRPKLPDRIITGLLKVISPQTLADAEGHVEVLRGSDLDWTVVRGPRLTDKPRRGTYRVGWVGVDASTQVSRDDLADFLVTQIDDREYVHQLPFVSA